MHNGSESASGESYYPASPTSTSSNTSAVSSVDVPQDTMSGISSDAIAIVGMSMKFPGDATDEDTFWEIMMSARSTASCFPNDRINHTAHYNSDTTAMGTIRSKKGHFLREDLAAFDADFFDFTAAEASAMDPQQRGLLETTYRALENSGISMSRIHGTNTAVYTGCFTADYMMLMGKDPESMPKYTATGVAAAMLSNRISAFFNLHGPSVTVDTACSSSLVALDQACQSLRLGQSSMGIVAGCNLIFSLDLTIGLSNMGFLSPDGICHSFDHKANGYARGEGFGVVVIKRLRDAVRDGDTIRAVIRATGTNQDGNTPLAQPSKEAQARLMIDTYENAGLDPSETKYVEAHGTGTPTGDPLEAAAIGTVFSAGRRKTDALYVSSLKANFGHLEGAAGLAGLIKTVLILERGIIPPLAGLETVNPDIDTDFLNIRFPLHPTPWPGRGLRRASVNSFGFGGTNAHVVLDDAHHYMQHRKIIGKHCTRILPPCSPDHQRYPSTTKVPDTSHSEQEEMPVVLAWSASDDITLEALISQYQRWFSSAGPALSEFDIWPSLTYTLLQRRSLFSWRSFTVVNPLEVSGELDVSRPIQSRSISDLSLAFVFTGQGAQWVGMGKELFRYEVFRKSIIDAVIYLMSLGCYWHTIGAFLGDLEPAGRIDDPEFAQPLCTILQVALVDLLEWINVHPSLVIGHSSGEIAAAYACGAIDRQSAWKLAYLRGTCSKKLAALESIDGAMIAVGLSEHDVQKYLNQIADEGGPGDLVVACVNSPASVTVSGDKEKVETLRFRLEKDSTFVRKLRVPVAYHSPHMEYVTSDYLDSIGEIKRGHTTHNRYVNMVSSVTGERIDKARLLDPGYWVRNMVSPVKFMQALQASFRNTRRMMPNKLDLSHREELWATDAIEIGPHGALAGAIRDSLRPLPHGQDVTYCSALGRKKHACTAFLASAGQLFCRGYPTQLSKLNWVADSNTQMVLPHLPNYPFNHSKSFWHESRISKNLRFRQGARNAFLGAPVADWNPMHARWRHFLALNESHWIADHRIKGQAIFPAAGMINMAIEAASQLAGESAICAFEITDATFHSALDLSAWPDGVEVSLQMSARRNTATGHGSVYDWSLVAYQSEVTEVCRGTIRSVPATQSMHVGEGVNYETHLSTRARSHFNRFSMRCLNELDGETLYQRLWNCGYHFGSSFRRIQTSKTSTTGEACAEVAVLEGQGSEMPTVVHPATLDGILQIMLPGITEGGQNSQFATSLPTRIDRLWIAKTGLLHQDTKSVKVAVKIKKDGFRTTKSDIVAFSQDASVKVFVEGIETTSITDRTETLPVVKTSAQRLCYNLVYKPDVDRVDPEQLETYLTRDVARRATSRKYRQELDILLYNFVSRAIVKVATPPSQGHLHKYFRWMQQQLNDPVLTGAFQNSELKWSSKSWYHDLKNEHPKYSKIFYRVGEHLTNLVNGNSDALTILFRDSAMSDFYENLLDEADFMTPLHRFLEVLTHKSPGISVLEVGAGTGSASKHILKSLTRRSMAGATPMYSRYCFTDISPSFFARAQSELSAYENMDFKVFNLEEDPFAQDFEAESFDLIVASLVLHATISLDKTLRHLHTLLKPGGRLIAVEVAAPDSIQAGFVFGLLPGWWLSDDTYRKVRLSPCLPPEEWQRAFACNGFSGVDHVFWDTQEVEHRLNCVMISTKLKYQTPTPMPVPLSSVAIVSAKDCDSVQLALVEKQLHDLDVPFMNTDFDALSTETSLAATLVIVIDSGTYPVLENLSGGFFDVFKKTLECVSTILWVSPMDGSHTNPSAGAVSGLSRTLRSENAVLQFTTFEADVSSCLARQASNLRAVIRQCLLRSSSSFEPEVAERLGMLQIPRLVEDVPRNVEIAEAGLDKVRREVHFGQANLRLTVKTPGLLDSLHFEQVEDSAPTLAPDEVEVRVKAVGVNFKDCLVALGRVSDDTLGTECAGVIERVGSSCTLRQGDRVAVLTLDTYRSIVRCKEALVVQIPPDISYVQASKLPTNFVTAYHALVELGRMSAGETVLIHAGAGGTGQAAIQIALHCGAEVFVTVGNKQKKELVMSTYGIPADHIFYSRDTSFAQGIKNITNGRGVDLVLNSLAGEGLQASWECIASYGRFLEMGKKDIFSREKLPMYQFARNVSFSAIDIAAMTRERPQLVAKSLKAVVALLGQGKIHISSPLKVFSILEIEEAFRWLQSGLNAGSVAVEMDHQAIVPALVSPRRKNLFCPDATYALAGGLGGQGRSIIRWMVTNGAKSILSLSRSGHSAKGAPEFVEEMRAAGVHVETPACDIADIAVLRHTLRSVAGHMPPLKGCINAAMVIRDNLFISMTQDDWKSVLNPKILGSWNLHECFPSNLDFFIMLASTSGIIGSSGQANYAAGNTYQDSLAAYRIARGQKAVSLDLSVMQEDGYFVDHKDALEQYLRIKKLVPMTQRDLFTVLEHYCDRTLTLESITGQVIMGLSLPADAKKKGEEPASWMSQPLFSHLHQMNTASTSSTIEESAPSARAAPLQQQLASTSSVAEATAVISSALQEKLARIFSRPSLDIDITKPIHTHGVDSLVAVELRNWFLHNFQADISVFEILGAADIATLGQNIASKLGLKDVK